MAIKTFTAGSVLTASDTNTYLANSGLVYVTSATISGTSITVSNCFTSTYRDYKIIVTGTTNSGTAADLTLAFTVGGTPNGTTNYYSNIMYNTHAGGPFRYYTGASTIGYCGTTASPAFSDSIDIFAPQIAFTTSWGGLGNGFGSTTAAVGSWFGNFNATTQFDGLQLTAGGNTITGTITIMGYRKA